MIPGFLFWRIWSKNKTLTSAASIARLPRLAYCESGISLLVIAVPFIMRETQWILAAELKSASNNQIVRRSDGLIPFPFFVMKH